MNTATTAGVFNLSATILKVNDLVKHFPIKGGVFNRQVASVRAVDGISLAIQREHTTSVVGESGCGKSTLVRLLNRLIEPSAGEVFYEDKNIFLFSRREMRAFRQNIQMVFQDPYSSLNPRFSMYDIIAEPLKIMNQPADAIRKRVRTVVELVGLSYSYRNRYPHEFSGGQRQRIGIARALALNPKILLCDEPVSALDVSVQAQVLNLLMDLRDELKLTIVFISHDLAVVSKISDTVTVLYFGKLVEQGERDDIFNNQLHPYTQALFSAIPKARPDEEKERIFLTAEPPSYRNFPSGCRFHPRCSKAMDICKKVDPELRVPTAQGTNSKHQVACHLYDGHNQQ
ncbi:MAG: ATP-binding cassette domain-containing protein [Pseudomonadota bacterium]|nr:ATP-binding cassette domain-containing protein [Pseudomonadota bacterium]